MTENLDSIRQHIKDELTPDRRERGKYLCPLCGSGSEPGQNHNGAFSIAPDGIHGKCFACGFYGDIFDLEAAKEGISLQEATRAVCARYGSGSPRSSAADDFREPVQPSAPADAPRVDFSELIEKDHRALPGSAGEKYLKGRGITPETIERFKLGFEPSHYFKKTKERLPGISIPYGAGSNYVGWRTISAENKIYDKPLNTEAGEEPVFNAAALASGEPVFVVESQLCAISIEQEGGRAVAIGGSGKEKLLRRMKDHKPAGPLILALDNDEPGKKAQVAIAEALTAESILFLQDNVSGDCKDPNELLQKDPEALRRNIVEAIKLAVDLSNRAQEEERAAYEGQTTGAAFELFEKFLDENGKRPPIPTGFSELDRVLNGGLTAGLYIMGAISSLGKTSWMLNIADNIAAAGRDVLYFSLEMSRNELIAKSISRFSFLAVAECSGPTGDAFSTFEVLNSRGKRVLNIGQLSTLGKACQRYQEGPGRHMWIFEGVSDFGAAKIGEAIENHIRLTGRVPVVFIDYLQILAPEDPRCTDKQNTDKAVVELKRLSAKHDLPIFCISSLNRQNYSEPITMAAFKESGAIEYGSDVLIGIQLYGVGYKAGEKQTAHADRVRELVNKAEKDPQVEIEVKVLKNRNGGRGGSGRLRFDKKYNFFSEIPDGFTYTDDPMPFDDDDPI